MTHTHTTPDRLMGIDALRGFCIIMVVFFHYLAGVNSFYLNFPRDIQLHFPGWLGVDLFFIISGYCIAMTALSSNSVADFLAKRFARIYPAYVFCGLITCVSYVFFDLPDREVTVIGAIKNLLGLNVLLPMRAIDGVYWSLIVEIKFYLLFALFYYFLGRTPIKLVTAWLIFCIIGWAAVTLDIPVKGKFIFPYSLMFLVGMVLYYRAILPTWLQIAAFSLAGIVIVMTERYADVVPYALGMLAIGVIVLTHERRMYLTPLCWLGAISYSWYLIHQNVGLIIIRELNAMGLYAISIPSAVGITLAIAYFSYRMVEGPYRTLARDWAKRQLGRIKLDRAGKGFARPVQQP